MNLRYKLLKRAQNYLKENNIWLKYRKQRNYVTYLSRRTEAEYWKEKFVNASNSKDFWKMVKQMQGVNKVKKIGPIKSDNKEIIMDDSLKAESLNSYFSKVGEKLAGGIQDQKNFTAKHHTHRITLGISNINITEEKIKIAVRKRSKPGKGSRHNNICSKDLHLLGDSASKGLNIVIRNSV